MKLRFLLVPIALALSAAVPAQTVTKWILGRGLHVRLPADPSSGGVPWSSSSLGLPTSWSAEGEGIRVEIAEQPRAASESEVLAEMGKALPGMANTQKFQVSSYSAYLASANGARVLGIQTPIRTWVAVAKGNDEVAMGVLQSITVERDGVQDWQRRYMPDFGIRTFLPFHWAVDLSAPSGPKRKNYELKFDGFAMNASVQTAEEGKTLDLKKTVDEDIKDHKSEKRYEGLKVSRIKIKEVKDGEIVTYDYKEKGRPKVQYFLVGRHVSSGAGITMRWTYDFDNPKHIDYSNRMLFSLDQPRFDNRGVTQKWSADNYGLSIEVPKPLEQTKSGSGMEEWSVGTGAMVITARVADYSGESNPKAVTDLLDQVFRGTQGAKEYSSKTLPVMVSAIDGMILKSKFKLAGNTWNYRYGLVLQTIQRTYVVDVLAADEDAAERIVESVRVNLKFQNPNLKRHQFKNSIFSVLMTGDSKLQDVPDDANFESQQILQFIEAGKLGFTQTSQKSKGGVVNVKGRTKPTVDEFAKAFKGKTTILNEGWAADGEAISYWVVFDIEANGQKYPTYCYTTVNGRDCLTQTVVYFQASRPNANIVQLLMNSYLGR